MTGSDLPAWRSRHGLTQAEAARLLGLTQQAVSKAEQSRRPLARPARLLMRLADDSRKVMAELRRLAEQGTPP